MFHVIYNLGIYYTNKKVRRLSHFMSSCHGLNKYDTWRITLTYKQLCTVRDFMDYLARARTRTPTEEACSR